MEVGGYHIIFMAYADDVRIGEVDIEHRVPIGAVTLVSPTLGIAVHKVWTSIGFVRVHFDSVEVYISCMAQIEALGRQIAPHGSLWVGFFFLVGNGIVDGLEVAFLHPTLMMDGDIR